MGSAKQFSEGFENREKLLDLLPKSQEELPAKSIKDGLQVAWLKLSDPAVKEKYVNFMTNVRLGRILEDLDTFAVWTSFMHNNTGWVARKYTFFFISTPFFSAEAQCVYPNACFQPQMCLTCA